MLRNNTTLAQLDEMTEAEVANLPVDHLAMLLEDVAVSKANVKRLDDKLTSALNRRYADKARRERHDAGKDTGRVSFFDGEYTVRADLPSIVDWNQDKLAEAAEAVRSWGEPEEDYLTVTRKMTEGKYKALPSSIRDVFTPARTIRTGKPSYELVRKEAA